MIETQKLRWMTILLHLAQIFGVLLNLAPYLEEVLEMVLQPRRQEVQRSVRLVPRGHYDVVLDEHAQVMAHGLVVQLERRRQRVRVVRPRPEQVDDFRAVQAPAGADDQVPQPLVHGDRAPNHGATYLRFPSLVGQTLIGLGGLRTPWQDV